MSRRPYVRPISKTTWYLRNGRYKVYVARELTSFLVAFYSFYVICALGIIAAGDAARWDSFLEAQQGTGWIVFHALALLYFLFYQTFPWFKLAPKAMPLQIGDRKIPASAIIAGHYLAWVVVSAFILWLAGVFS
jgi:fumarate reductase subunit C